MNSIHEIREATGMSQWQLAQWLGMTRSHYSMAETGRRNLPLQASLKLYALRDLLLKTGEQVAEKKTDPHVQPQLKKAHRMLMKQATGRRLQAAAHQQKLQQLLRRKQKAEQLLQLIPLLRAAPSGSAGDRIVLDMFESELMAYFDKAPELQIRKLQLQISNLAMAADNAVALAQELSGTMIG